MKKRLLASILSLVMVFSLVPVSALAEDEEPGGAVCTCEARCAEGAVDETCPVCAEDDTLCAFEEVPADEEEPTPCTVTEGCTLEAGHEGECVLPDEPEVPAGDPADAPSEDDGGDNDTIGIDHDQQGAPTESAVVEQLQERINALPTEDALAGMDEDELAEAYAEVCAIYDAIDELTGDEAAELDVTALEKAAAFFTQQIMPLEDIVYHTVQLRRGPAVLWQCHYPVC